MQSCRQKNIRRGAQNSKKHPKLALLASSMRRGPNEKNTEKKQKKQQKHPKNSTFKRLSTIFAPCMKIQGRGHGPSAPHCRHPWLNKDFVCARRRAAFVLELA